MSLRVVIIGLNLLSLLKANQKLGTQLVRETLATICPFSTFCHVNASKEFALGSTKNDLCCQRCSCESDCWKPGNCCIDKDDVDDKRPIFKCKESIVKRQFDDVKIYDGVDNQYRRYNIIDFCPDTKTDPVLDTKCRLSHPASLEELVWVSDTKSGIIYQNRYCAECHGAEDYTYWQIATQCFGALRSNFSSLFKQLMSDYCSVNNIAPDSIYNTVNKFSCFHTSYMYSECNVTGVWRDFDEDILTACRKFNSPVFQPSFTGAYIIYRNIFCFLCNADHAFYDFCPNLFDTSRLSMVEFSALLNFDLYITLHENAADGNGNTLQCREEEFFDVYMERCRPLICPFGRAPVHGHCEKIAMATDGLGVDINFYATIPPGLNQTATFGDENHQKVLAKRILAQFLTSSGLQKMKCNTCGLLVGLSKNVSQQNTFVTGIHIFGNTYTDKNCQLDDIILSLREFLKKHWKIRVTDTEYLVVQVQHETRTMTEVMQMTDVLIRYKSRTLCKQKIDFSSEFFCPAVDLNYLDVLSFEDYRKKRLLKELFAAKRHSFGVLRLCVDEYYSFMSQQSSGVATIWNGMQYKSLFLSLYFKCAVSHLF